ncbi:MAG: AAA family ATPase, partial [Deltaproteobacteria bacterium]|nr:AAA family ATPase [Deltaproteobacteria bacterium]
MEDEFNDLASGVQTFAEIIQEESSYVDKTAFLARMISDKNKVWFLARPRRFGKSLTVSTLEDLFSGRKELFKGLYIESKLDEERFAPRPVVRLDMSDLPADSVEAFEAALGRKTVKIAEELGVTVDPTITPGEILKKTIKKAAEKAGRPVAVLIDEYDAPFVAVMDSLPEEREQFRAAMRAYYAIFKSTDRYISFIFVTGITKAAAHIDLIPAFNSYNDLSINPEYGAICGFTQGELEGYFGHHLKRTAERLKMTETELLEKTRDFYYGFCFDGVTRVYNPFSTLLFFQ